MPKHIKELNELQCLLGKPCGSPGHDGKLATHYFDDVQEGTTHYRCYDCVENLRKKDYAKTKTRKVKYLQTKNGSSNKTEYNKAYYSDNSEVLKKKRLERYYKSKKLELSDTSKRSLYNKAYYEKNKEVIKKRRRARYYECKKEG